MGQVKYGTDYLSDAASSDSRRRCRELNDRELSQGRHITRLDVAHAAPVCTVGFDIVDKLLPGTDPIGKEIHVDTVDVRSDRRGERSAARCWDSRRTTG